ILNFRKFNWKNKLETLIGLTKYLNQIHIAGYVHGDLHSGNILLSQDISGGIISYIADLGLSRKIEESDSEGVYGVLPYVAPEVLNKQPYTTASDIYSFGVIMAEISTGKPPYYDIDYDVNLAIRICNGLRPEFDKSIPECYIQLANRCMDANPSCRPTASDIYNMLSNFWYYITSTYAEKFEDERIIKEAFESADLIIPTSHTLIPNYSQTKFTSKLLNFQNLSNPLISFASKPLNFQILSNPLNSSFCDSTLQNCLISDNINSPIDQCYDDVDD
ncbi:kinase-like domain-containing protein, partial [Gigaspora rosea]